MGSGNVPITVLALKVAYDHAHAQTTSIQSDVTLPLYLHRIAANGTAKGVPIRSHNIQQDGR